MRIAYLVNQYPKVSHSFIRREILALEREGLEVTRISIRGWDADLVDEADVAERARTRYVLQTGALAICMAAASAALTRPGAFARTLLLAFHMARRAERSLPYHLIYLAEACLILHWLRQSGVAHVHAHFGTNSAEVAMLVHSLGGPPFSFTVHGPEEFDKAPLLGLAEKVRHAAFVVAISSFGRSQLFRLVESMHWSKIQVVRCGLDQADFEAESDYRETRNLVCVGRLCEQKGQLMLIQAARLLAEADVDFELILVGDGEQRRDIAALITEFSLDDRVRITGWASSTEVRSHLRNARALVLPSFAEGLPVVIMEAMALRRPIISTFVAGIPELVRDQEHGWLVPAGDVTALAAAMRSCLDSTPAKLQSMGQAAFERVNIQHHVATSARELKRLFLDSD
ncbi:glycosyltransferase [Bradyrhizobium sp. STM 3809]|uniref:glycosyltransferase n=1 Tax=Bradyrhizobium sp. STM 3809 TaxID=551936 RepID=UPI00024098DD|nr:glycosyltransferase [Bradyrhizobium sp. STM 3809]CCE02115.1 putative Glycosyl transferase, group 1 family protein [Bradyrhizobium sp. STM 3809]